MNSDEIVIELGLVSERTLGSLGPECEVFNLDPANAEIDDPEVWRDCPGG